MIIRGIHETGLSGKAHSSWVWTCYLSIGFRDAQVDDNRSASKSRARMRLAIQTDLHPLAIPLADTLLTAWKFPVLQYSSIITICSTVDL